MQNRCWCQAGLSLFLFLLAACAGNPNSAAAHDVTTGPEAAAPAAVDAVVTYRDKWMWDITMYMIELSITLRNPENDYPLAVGNSYHTSLTRLSPEEMVKEVLANIFAEDQAAGG